MYPYNLDAIKNNASALNCVAIKFVVLKKYFRLLSRQNTYFYIFDTHRMLSLSIVTCGTLSIPRVANNLQV